MNLFKDRARVQAFMPHLRVAPDRSGKHSQAKCFLLPTREADDVNVQGLHLIVGEYYSK